MHRHLERNPAGVVHAPVRDAEPLADPGSDEDGRIDWTRPAEDVARFVEARRPLCPNAFTHHGGRRLDVLAARVSRGRYSGEPGLVLHGEDEGVVVVTGADRSGRARPGLVLQRLRPEGGGETAADEYIAAGDSSLLDLP